MSHPCVAVDAASGFTESRGAVWRKSVCRRPPRRFPYGIVYCVAESQIRALALAHRGRRPGLWRDRS